MDGCTFEMIVGMAVFSATGGNPSGSRPNFFGRQHLTFDKGGKDMVLSEGGCGFERVMGMTDVWGWWAGGDGDRFTEKREVLLR